MWTLSPVVTRSGATSSMANLKKVAAKRAKAAIVLAACGQGASEEEKQISDAKVIKTILALIGCQGGKNGLNIVSELFFESNRRLVDTFESELTKQLVRKNITDYVQAGGRLYVTDWSYDWIEQVETFSPFIDFEPGKSNTAPEPTINSPVSSRTANASSCLK